MKKPVPGYDGYEVSDDGGVFSLKTGRWLKPSLSHDYPVVNLTLGGLPRGARGVRSGRVARQSTVRVHRLMHLAFFGGLAGVINHRDGNKQNNRLSNLEVVSSAENNAHAYRVGLRQCVRLLRSDGTVFASVKEAAHATGVSRSAIVRHLSGAHSAMRCGFSFSYANP